MDTLVIYDTTGFIIFQASGSVREPVGIPFKWINVPSGKMVVSINMGTEEPVFEDLPVDDITLLKRKIDLMQSALDELILGG